MRRASINRMGVIRGLDVGAELCDHLAALVEAGYSNKEAEDISGPKRISRVARSCQRSPSNNWRAEMVSLSGTMRCGGSPRSRSRGRSLRQALGQLLSGGEGPLAPGREMT
jgi:hypothetical protein